MNPTGISQKFIEILYQIALLNKKQCTTAFLIDRFICFSILRILKLESKVLVDTTESAVY